MEVQSALRHLHVPCTIVVLGAALIAGLIPPTGASAASDSDAGPSIAAIKLGIKGYCKVGCWTPVRIETKNIEGLKNPRIEVTVPDSDGVPTTVAAPLPNAGLDKSLRAAMVYTKIGRVGSPIQ